MKYNIDVLPATFGDCLWIEYGTDEKTHRILIDGGTAGTKEKILNKISALPEKERHFELIVVTHIDDDHIAGIDSLLKANALNFTVGDFWFNGWHHLTPPTDKTVERFGPKKGEFLAAEIQKHSLPWNALFDGKAVGVDNPKKLPRITLPGGMEITVLSPTPTLLTALRPKWEILIAKLGQKPGFGLTLTPTDDKKIERFGIKSPDIKELVNQPFEEDITVANGSSIAFLASYGGKTVLFAGDAFPSVIKSSLDIKDKDQRTKVDVLKVSHHGSTGSTSPDLLQKLDCKNFIISTNGSRSKHPTEVTIARLIKLGGPDSIIHFNYKSPQTEIWGSDTMKKLNKYQCVFPEKEGICVKLIDG